MGVGGARGVVRSRRGRGRGGVGLSAENGAGNQETPRAVSLS